MLRHTLPIAGQEPWPEDRPKIKPHPSLYSLTPEEQIAYLALAKKLDKYVEEWRNNGYRLPDRMRDTAAQELNVTPRQVNNLIFEYTWYPILYPGEQAASVLIPNPPGRPREEKLTPDQQHVALYAYLNNEWIVVYKDNRTQTIKMKPKVNDVYRLLKHIWPDLTVSEQYVRRFISNKGKDDPALFGLARKGQYYFWSEFVLKKKVDFKYPDAFWLLDDRPLPCYVRMENGDICTVSFLGIQDGYTGIGLRQRVLPRKVLDEKDAVRRSSITAQAVRQLFAATMYYRKRRPFYLYTDNAGVNQALEELLPYLTDGDSPETESKYSKHGRPQGRGKDERFQALINEVIRKTPGFVENERDPFAWREAYRYCKKHASELHTVEELEQEVNGYVDEVLNKQPFKKGLSREEYWSEVQVMSLPVPNPPSLARLAGAVVWDKMRVSSEGILYNKIYYHPISEGGYNRVTDNVGKRVPFCIIPFGNDDYLALACLDGSTYEEVVDQEKINISVTDHTTNQERSFKHKKTAFTGGLEIFYEILQKEYRPDALPGFVTRNDDIVPVTINQAPKKLPKGSNLRAKLDQNSETDEVDEVQDGFAEAATNSAEETVAKEQMRDAPSQKQTQSRGRKGQANKRSSKATTRQSSKRARAQKRQTNDPLPEASATSSTTKPKASPKAGQDFLALLDDAFGADEE